MRLHDLVVESARRDPDALAVQDATTAVTYGELDRLADRYAAALLTCGVTPGERVVIWTAKSVGAVALMQGCLRVGAVYVPVAPSNPPARVERIALGCQAALVVADEDGLARASGNPAGPQWRELGALARDVEASVSPAHHSSAEDDLAYILYTSGSTGEPKGVCLSHTNALAFVRWACAELRVGPDDRLSNHAPFNFDLSVFDLYGAFLAGASVHLVGGEAAYAPEQLVRLIAERELTIWYSVPSALALMITKGGLLDGLATTTLRCCVFAGEPFAVEHVRQLRASWPEVRLFNWYGPTETNVCASYEVGPLEAVPARTVPIGRACSGDALELVASPDGTGTELVVSGPTVMLGYWGAAPQVGPYHTGDLVRRTTDGDLDYVGRRDHMVKIRGHRIELAEIETVLVEHEAVAEALVVVVGDGLDAQLHAVLVPADGRHAPSLLAVKQHGARRLPTYMLVDAVHEVSQLPRTSNGKRDSAAVVAAIQQGSLT
ncbi:amino acid adenylation domain-containing protein [Pseudonocardia sp. MH-G8]|uniref:amino acid adenylation domain-containing protein n=1 Tax=Pseudonocardia sp. MH-G8 TaxID=1854588 RepID=UPI000BA0CAD4|nr:amino acid adenylation domain-containing protein [Pseudonocardia sp. MH-G8]OZM83072.1 D-alanine--poly(phosphoribitol) ligase [Pseudonocardia sp. MH-G8]